MTDLASEMADLINLDQAGIDQTKYDRKLTALAEEAVDVVRDGRAGPLGEMFDECQGALRRVIAKLPADVEASSGFLAGMLAGVTEVVGAAYARNQSDDFAEALADSRHAGILAALEARDLSNTELAARTGETEETIARKLKALEAAGVVIRQKSGRRVYSSLSAAARDARGGQGRSPMSMLRPLQELPADALPALATIGVSRAA